MSKVKTKRVIPKEAQADINEITKMFDQMTGASNADLEIIVPKYVTVRNRLRDYCKVYKILIDFEELKQLFDEYENIFKQITDFIEDVKQFIQEQNKELAIESADKDTVEIFKSITEVNMNAIWKKLKDHPCVKAVLITTSRLKRFEQFLSPNKLTTSTDAPHKSDLDDGFIKREPGLDMILLSFADLDLKHLWASEKATPMIKKLVLNILSKSYIYGFEIYDLITSPDVDIKKFSSLLISSIQALKHQIPRCDKAFDIISDSVMMLESNFKSYYRSSIEAQNPSVILESFIVDVSMKQKNNIHVMNQFRMIIRHLQKNSSGNKDPRVKSLFSMLNKQINIIDEKYCTQNAKANNQQQNIEEKQEKTKAESQSNVEPVANQEKMAEDVETKTEEPNTTDDNLMTNIMDTFLDNITKHQLMHNA